MSLGVSLLVSLGVVALYRRLQNTSEGLYRGDQIFFSESHILPLFAFISAPSGVENENVLNI